MLRLTGTEKAANSVILIKTCGCRTEILTAKGAKFIAIRIYLFTDRISLATAMALASPLSSWLRIA